MMTAAQMRQYTIRVSIYVALIVLALGFLLPVYLVVITALKDPATINLPTT
jgi:glucose/mannose transport system permease protein